MQNVLFGRYAMVSGQVKDYVYGLYGKTPTPIDADVSKQILKGYERGEEPITGRAADYLEPEMEKAREDTRGIARDIGDVLVYALYPVTGLRFLQWKYGLEPVPDDVKPKTIEQINEEAELVAKAKAGELVERGSEEAAAEPAPAALPRSFTVYVGGEQYQVEVEPMANGQTARVTAPAAPAAAAPVEAPRPAPAAQPTAPPPAPAPAAPPPEVAEGTVIRAPMPGILLRYAVEVGQEVKEGETVLFLEAMKMENAIPSPVSGTVKELRSQAGARVVKNDILAVIG